MKVITTNQELVDLCNKAHHQPYITVDTEFVSEKTYYPQLCLIQIALPVKEEKGCTEFIIDTLNPKLKLGRLKAIFQNPKILKIFHSAGADLEIFLNVFGDVPNPFFDTQVAAMFCGYGSQISYSNIVREICGLKLDKSMQFSNWSTRPLTQKQLEYAISDVTHLRQVYLCINEKLLENGRLNWIEDLFEEMVASVKSAKKPENAWKRIKAKNFEGINWSILYALAEFRELQAQKKNIQRKKLLSDQALLELVSVKPKTIEGLRKCRFYNVGNKSKNQFHEILLEVIRDALANPRQLPKIVQSKRPYDANRDVTELLKVYLKYSSLQSGVAEEVIATVDELREISQGNFDVRPLKGWRKELFGNNALKLCQGKIALTIKNTKLAVVE